MSQPKAVAAVAAHATPLSPARIREALRDALTRADGHAPSASFVDVLAAQVEHETARGSRMFNHNFGGIKGAAPDGGTTSYRTREVVDGASVATTDHFRAYRSVAAGARDYVAFLRAHYASAVERAEHGDARGFAERLKERGYYTGSVDEYARSLVALVSDRDATTPARSEAPAPPVDRDLLGAFRAVLDVSAIASTIAAPVEADEEARGASRDEIGLASRLR